MVKRDRILKQDNIFHQDRVLSVKIVNSSKIVYLSKIVYFNFYDRILNFQIDGPLSPIKGDDEAERFFKMERQLMDRTQRNQMTLKQRLEFRKFKMLKLMVMYLQQIPLFGKYCFYGCYCFPNMGQDFTVGKGKPMDEVDSKCRDFSSKGSKSRKISYRSFVHDFVRGEHIFRAVTVMLVTLLCW